MGLSLQSERDCFKALSSPCTWPKKNPSVQPSEDLCTSGPLLPKRRSSALRASRFISSLFVAPGGTHGGATPACRPCFQAGWRRAAQRLCSGRLSSVVIAILLHLVMCTDVLGKHPRRRRGSAQYPCSPMTRLSESLSGLAPRGGGSHLKSLDFGVLTRV